MDYMCTGPYLLGKTAHFQISSKDWQTNTIIACFSYFSHSFLYTFLHDRCSLLCVLFSLYLPLLYLCAVILNLINAGQCLIRKRFGCCGSKPNPQENVKVLFFVPCKADIPFYIFLLTERRERIQRELQLAKMITVQFATLNCLIAFI